MIQLRRMIPAMLVALLLLLGAAAAQQQPRSTRPPSQGPAQAKPHAAGKPEPPAPMAGPETPGEQLAEASEKAAGEENAEFKQSPSVQFLARLTGMSPQSAYWLAIAVNFAVIAGAILWFMRSSLPGMFRARTESIRKTMEEAQRASADATRRLNEIEARLARFDEELAAMRSAAETEAASEEERIRAAAQEEARKIEEAVGQEVAAATRLAERELKAYAAELAVSLAEKRITVDPPTDRVLVENFVEQLGKNGSGGEGR